MAFDSNPQAVYNGEGYAELRQVAQTTFDFETATDNDAVISETGTAITVADFTGRALFAKIRRTGGSTGRVSQASAMVDLRDIAGGAHNTGDALNTDDDTIAIPGGQVTWFMSRGSGGHIILASSDVSVAPGNAASDEATLTLYELM